MNPHEVVMGEVESPLCGARDPFGNRAITSVETSVLEQPRNNPEMKDFWSAHAESTIQGSVSKVAIPG